MSTYFHGWQRKLGVVMLAMACVLIAGWVRSFSIYDVIGISRGHDYLFLLESNSGKLSCTDINRTPAGQFDPYPRHVSWSTGSNSHYGIEEYPDDASVRWGWRGFGLTEWRPGTLHATTTELAAPYWSIVIPLTLLSAYLLLRKPKTTAPR